MRLHSWVLVAEPPCRCVGHRGDGKVSLGLGWERLEHEFALPTSLLKGKCVCRNPAVEQVHADAACYLLHNKGCRAMQSRTWVSKSAVSTSHFRKLVIAGRTKTKTKNF